MINKALESALSPYKALCIDKRNALERGSLYLWSKLALNSNTLKSHTLNFTRDKKMNIDFSLYLNIEIARLFHTTAVFHSVHQRQDEALADQEQLLNIMTAIDIPQDICTEFMSVKIPLLEKERSVIQDCLSAVLSLQSEKGETLLTDEPEMLRIKGNEAFKDNRYHDAIQYYTEGIRFSKEDLVDVRLYSNRSLMYLKINDNENALKDAEKCIILAPKQWKAHCWKAYAMANLVRNGHLPAEFEKVCLASACIAAELNDECLLEYKMKINYPLVVYKIIQKSDDLGLEISSLEQRPYTSLLLKSGYYKLLDPVVTTKSVQIIGIEDNVEIDLKHCFLIFRQPDSSFVITFQREKQIHIHFENVSFVSGSAQIGVLSNAIATFYRCKISNGPKGCDDFPKCNGGSGCVRKAGECNRQGKNKGFANFASGQVGYPGIWVDSGGKLIVQNCILDRCGGGGVLADGDNACLEIRHCTIQNMRQMGVEARNGGMVKVEDNVIIDNQFHGIAIGPRGYGVLSRNLIQGNGQEGIFCGGMLNPNSIHKLEMMSEETSRQEHNNSERIIRDVIGWWYLRSFWK
ncbi:STIP1 [Mytilus coruscus]|uniref:STIP1 n=1 Tax=Mytilus coruscus TaxID=42192 RepID=A0A6J8AY90_MYTCO|nr:STIP1 [Mytilus coruscus]